MENANTETEQSLNYGQKKTNAKLDNDFKDINHKMSLKFIQFIHKICVVRAWKMDKLSVNEVLLTKKSTINLQCYKISSMIKGLLEYIWKRTFVAK